LPGAIRTHDRFATAPSLRTRNATTRGGERERATKRASISGDGGDPAAARAAAPQQQRQASMEHYGCHVDAPRLRFHAGKKESALFCLFRVFYPLSVSLFLSRCRISSRITEIVEWLWLYSDLRFAKWF